MVVRMKISDGRAKPEFDDVAQVAAKTGMAIGEVASRAEEAWRLAQRAADRLADADTDADAGTDAGTGTGRAGDTLAGVPDDPTPA
jgi:hypothetical protein